MRARTSALAIVIAAMAWSVSCGQDDATGGHSGPSTLVEEVRIGQLDGAEEYLFGRVQFVTVDSDGSIYAADSQLGTIRKYDATGAFVRQIGRKGEGPGEYDRFLGLRCLPNDTLAVLTVPHRFIIYSPDGEYVRDFRVESQLHTHDMIEHDDDNHVYVKRTVAPAPTTDDWQFELVEYDLQGRPNGTVELPLAEPSHEPFVLIFPGGPRRNFPVETCSAWSPRGYRVTGRSDSYAIAANGTTLVARDVEPVPLTPEEKEEWEAWAKFFSGERYTIPDVKPLFRRIEVADDGRILVHRYVAAVRGEYPEREPGDKRPILHWREPTTVDVFTPDGEFSGTVVVPDGAFVHVWRGSHAWGVRAGDEGYTVVRWRIEPSLERSTDDGYALP